ncbi:MAG: tetratricopeptide repeat protein [Candidatus Rokubacteria bacterium]|nr:tetratricopeptide repeat protein [Candidatus Rokubacteria bacterium]
MPVAWVALALAALALAGSPEQAALLEQLRGGTATERRAAATRLGEVGDAAATADLARALRDPDAAVREGAQAALWAIWQRSGDREVDALLQHGIALMGSGLHEEAAATFTEVIARAPQFAEGWNKRATVYYLMGEYDRSLADCEEVIRRNPIHFGALSGFGLIYLEKGDLERAARYFERALAVNPNMTQIERVLERLREVLLERRRQAI